MIHFMDFSLLIYSFSNAFFFFGVKFWTSLYSYIDIFRDFIFYFLGH